MIRKENFIKLIILLIVLFIFMLLFYFYVKYGENKLNSNEIKKKSINIIEKENEKQQNTVNEWGKRTAEEIEKRNHIPINTTEIIKIPY